MPISWREVIPHILDKVEHFQPKSILDIGIGFGKYGVLMRELFELPFERYDKDQWELKIDGVEAFAMYQNPLHDYAYNHVFYEDIADITDQLPQYDVILMIDVLEHFDKEKGKSLLKALVKRTKKAIVISTPKYPDPQEAYLGNTYEAHLSRWTNIDLLEFDFTLEHIQIKQNGAQLIIIYPPDEKKESGSQTLNFSKDTPSGKMALSIGYFLPHHNLTGGLKMLLEQMRHLKNKGHKITAFYRGNQGEVVLPDWTDLKVDREVLVPTQDTFLSYIEDCDVVIAGWLEQLPELADSQIPIVYWEQGNEWIFGEELPFEYRDYLRYCFSQPVHLASVSPLISKAIETRFSRESTVIPNGINCDFYYPEAHPNQNEILLVGNPYLLFKGFDVALRTLFRVWKAGGRFKVKWICQAPPQLENVPFPFPIEYIVNPSQTELAKEYRESDLFLFTSWYEGFGMPPLEAMASGVPVVSTNCGGVESYMEDGFNGILADPGDVNGLAEGILHLLNDSKERERLSKNGRDTALKFHFPNVIKELEQYLFTLVKTRES